MQAHADTAPPNTATAAAEPPEECAWCKFMKSGPCKSVFETWQSCVDGVMDAAAAASPPADGGGGSSNTVAVEQCASVTGPLFECMAQHRAYYGSQLDGMAGRTKEAEQQVEQEAAAKAAGAAGAPASSRADAAAAAAVPPGAEGRGTPAAL